MTELNKAERTCLKCQKPFKSLSYGNRICPKCTPINNAVKLAKSANSETTDGRRIRKGLSGRE